MKKIVVVKVKKKIESRTALVVIMNLIPSQKLLNKPTLCNFTSDLIFLGKKKLSKTEIIKQVKIAASVKDSPKRFKEKPPAKKPTMSPVCNESENKLFAAIKSVSGTKAGIAEPSAGIKKSVATAKIKTSKKTSG